MSFLHVQTFACVFCNSIRSLCRAVYGRGRSRGLVVFRMTMLWRCAGLLALALALMMIINSCTDDPGSAVLGQPGSAPAAALFRPGNTSLALHDVTLPVLASYSPPASVQASTELRSVAAAVKRRLTVGGGDPGNLVSSWNRIG